jgi:hypothetical protein
MHSSGTLSFTPLEIRVRMIWQLDRVQHQTIKATFNNSSRAAVCHASGNVAFAN